MRSNFDYLKQMKLTRDAPFVSDHSSIMTKDLDVDKTFSFEASALYDSKLQKQQVAQLIGRLRGMHSNDRKLYHCDNPQCGGIP